MVRRIGRVYGGELVFIGLDTFSFLHVVQAMTSFALMSAAITALHLVGSSVYIRNDRCCVMKRR